MRTNLFAKAGVSAVEVSTPPGSNRNLGWLVAGSIAFYVLFFGTWPYLHSSPTLMPRLVGWTRYFDLALGWQDLTGAGWSFLYNGYLNAGIFGLALGGLFWLYYAAYQRVRRSAVGAGWVFGVALGLGLLMIVQPYMLSSDVFSYSLLGRIMGVYGQNPFRAAVETFPNDPVFTYIPYTYRVGFNNYGPVWTLFSGGLSALATANVAVQVLLYRLAALGFHLLTGWLIWQVTGSDTPANRPAAALLYLWNPLMLIEVGSAHNDFFVTFFIMAGVWFYAVGSRWPGLASVALAPLSKILVGPLLPSFLIMHVWQAPTRLRRLVSLALGSLLILAIAVLLYLPFLQWQNTKYGMQSAECGIGNAECKMQSAECRIEKAECGETSSGQPRFLYYLSPQTIAGGSPLLQFSFQPSFFNLTSQSSVLSPQSFRADPGGESSGTGDKSSLDNLVYLVGGKSLYLNSFASGLHSGLTWIFVKFGGREASSSDLANLIVRNGLRLIFGLLVLREFWITRDWPGLLRSLLRIMFYAVFFLYSWFFPWYLVPLVALAAVNRWELWSKAAILLSFTVGLYYCLWPLRDMPGGYLLALSQWRGMLIFGIPGAYLLWGLWRQRRATSRAANPSG